MRKSNRFVVISGCSGGGKSTLLVELSKRGFVTVLEPGRRVVERQQLSGGTALPWQDPRRFLLRVEALACQDLEAQDASSGWTFFDRGLVDAVSGLAFLERKRVEGHPRLKGAYHPTVFLTPPWQEIYRADAQRQHSFAQAKEEYERLRMDYPRLGYEVVQIPKMDVSDRADFVLHRLGLG